MIRQFILVVTILCVGIAGAEAAEKFVPKIDAKIIIRFSPKARADIVQAIVDQWSQKAGGTLDTPLRIQHFFAQIATETGGMRLLEENLRYSSKRILEVFPSRVSPDEAQDLANNPIKLANKVYNNRLGNNPPMDGWTYRGSGLIQLTGRENFKKRGLELSLPFEKQPDLVRSTDGALTAATAFWKARDINKPADKDDVVEVRRRVNGGKNGLPEAKLWLAKAKKVFSEPGSAGAAGATFEEALALKELLISRKLIVVDPGAAPDPQQVENALKTFQENNGIEASGTLDDDTFYQLTDPDNFKGLGE
ncbi:MAG TPA: hypothetical protein VGV39_19715 [Mesorhizobium sp.]|jgi:putative chitinase|uniref:glycoside hydrolase family 19 protein n=1 Tax=Mesorhizobium sp. TaxID=1871066 RepID=UPI002DDD80B0|nr:hypothetical protein [Mesorhizobium sp.]HEV2505314.1 hypothetical protein [Mesorhizobium sp.]